MNPPGRPRRGGRLALVVLLVALVTVGSGGPAGAHADLIASEPSDGTTSDTPPTEVVLTFTEPVSIELGGIEVLDDDGEALDLEPSSQPTPEQVAVALPASLPDGAYLATYRVVSTDGHVITGAISFGVGDVAVDPGSASGSGTDSGPWEPIGGVARFLTILGALLAAGGTWYLAFVLRADDDLAPLRALPQLGVGVACVGMLAWLMAQGALASGRGWAGASDLTVLQTVIRDTLGWQLLGVLVAGFVVVVTLETRNRRVLATAGTAGALALCASFVTWGHATSSERAAVAVPADVIHTVAAAAWFGGLVLLAATLARRRRGDGSPDAVADTAATVARFSTMALVTVVVLWLAGVALALDELGRPGELLGSSYGRLVAAKGGLVAVVVAMAAWNRQVLVPRIVDQALGRRTTDPGEADPHETDSLRETDSPHEADPTDSPTPPWRQLHRTVLAEAAVLVVVVGLTAVLVDTSPPTAGDGVDGGPFQQLVDIGDDGTQVQLAVVPGQAGPNDLHLSFYDASGAPLDFAESVSAELSLPSAGIAPITRDLPEIGTGHYFLESREMTVPGAWTILVRARVSRFDEATTTFTVPIGDP